MGASLYFFHITQQRWKYTETSLQLKTSKERIQRALTLSTATASNTTSRNITKVTIDMERIYSS